MALLDGVKACDDGTATEQAFKKRFRVGIQNKFLRTPEIIRWMGTPTTGSRAHDIKLQENFVEILATPIACVEYYLMGAPLKFRNAAIPNQILTILRQHVKNWDYISNHFYNAEPPPLEDLDDIVEFCELIVKYAAAGGRRENSWLIAGRAARRAPTNGSYKALEIGSRRRMLGGGGSNNQGDVKTGVDARAEKMMNFRKNFSLQKEESK